jgi:hypothetical protein
VGTFRQCPTCRNIKKEEMRYPQDRRMFSCDKCDKSFFEESPNSYIVCPDRLAVTPMTTYRL